MGAATDTLKDCVPETEGLIMKRCILALVPLVLLAGCSSSGPGATAAPTPPSAPMSSAAAEPEQPTTAAVDPTATAPTTAAPKDAHSIAAAVAADVKSAENTVDLTEDTDGNDLLGRPHQYTSATVINIQGATCGDGPGVDCGAVVEVFDNEADAKARAKYIDSVTASLGSAFVEYDTQAGNALLRVSGSVKPSVAKQYKAAFLDVAGS
ncbi:hypothetical protein [Cellulomonas massiliensis]|uniref:hypothetical protein n=1 Tax=Cellulomonas massiliensis TaxID=1465811 RepID=UPI000374857F|nr:hypothetical protein [Cellulomonas massiliensis]